MGVAQACYLMDDRNRKGTVFSYLVATEPHWPRISSILQNFLRYPLSCFSPKIHLQDLWKRFQFVLDHNLGHFEANLFDRAEIVKEAGKNRRFLGTLERWTNDKKLATKPDADLTSPRARVSLLAAHEHLREKRRYLAGVQYRKYLYILSYSSITRGVLRCFLGFLALWGQKPYGGNYHVTCTYHWHPLPPDYVPGKYLFQQFLVLQGKVKYWEKNEKNKYIDSYCQMNYWPTAVCHYHFQLNNSSTNRLEYLLSAMPPVSEPQS